MKTLVFNLPLIFGLIFPFVGVLQGLKPLKGFFFAWGGLIITYLFFTTIFPLFASVISSDYSIAISSFFPDPPYVVAMLFMGWIYAAITVLIAWGIRTLFIIKRKKGKPPTQN